MLRALILILISIQVYAEEIEYSEPTTKEINQQNAVIKQALKQSKEIQKDGSLKEILNQERKKLNSLNEFKGLNITMPEFLEKERTDRYLAKALAAGRSISDKASNQTINDKNLIVLVSFSMPESQIKSLISEGYRIGAKIAVRGLINDDFEKTLIKLKTLAGKMDGSVLIDPTLFMRFSTESVPTFVLPLEPLANCSNKGCPTPEHIKASGSASFQYFLDLVARSGNQREKQSAKYWLAKYEK